MALHKWMCCTAALVFTLSGSAVFAQNVSGPPPFVADQVIVGFQPGTPGSLVAEAHRQAGAAELRRLDAIGAQLVQVPAGAVLAAVAAYERNPNVRYAEPNYLRPMVLPDEGQDPPRPFGLGIDYFDEQYGLHNTGQAFFYDQMTGAPGAIAGTADADIDAPEAWELSTGSPAITVAVLDSGVDCDHADLAGKCVEIINFGPSDTTEDVIGHGTHVAGIAAATGDNGIGTAGVGWQTSIANIKVCYEYYDLFSVLGLCDSAAIAQGMIHAADQGYQVINMSFGGPSASQAEADAAAYAWNAGALLVSSAGNSYTSAPGYPAAFAEVIAVAATDWHDNLGSFSNFGSWVSLSAPGHQVFSTMPYAACGLPDTDPEGCYGWLSGTSMASPMVAGAAAVVWAYMGAGATNQLVRDALETQAESTGAMGQNMLAWTQHGRLNLKNSLQNGGSPPPPPPPGDPGAHIGDLDGSAVSQGRDWTATVMVTVHDEAEALVSGVTVNGSWTGGHTGPASCVTDNGQCTISTPAMVKRSSSSATFTVSGIADADYQGAANHDPDGDSDGNSITVVR
jgi:thermitase